MKHRGGEFINGEQHMATMLESFKKIKEKIYINRIFSRCTPKFELQYFLPLSFFFFCDIESMTF